MVDHNDPRPLLTSAAGNDKIGGWVRKGKWRGMPIYLVTLEERATCPSSCANWETCYGNGMPFARRHHPGPAFEKQLEAALAEKQHQHPRGFVVRLHQLGDFYSLDYVRLWESWLARFPAMRCYGYTAWPKDTEIGGALWQISRTRWRRFAVRFSTGPQSQGAHVIWHVPDDGRAAEGLVCPEQMGKTKSCGTCALCWAPAARTKTIVFVGHGIRGRAA